LLEPCAVKVARTVLRGGGSSNGASLPYIQKIALYGATRSSMSWITALPFPPRRAAAFSAFVAMASGPLYAQTLPVPGKAPSAPTHARSDDQDLPITMRAEEFNGRPDRIFNMYRNVEVTRGATGITADTACYRRVEDEIAGVPRIGTSLK
jgi:hypothetical protein